MIQYLNNGWKEVFERFCNVAIATKENDFIEAIDFSYRISPCIDWCMSTNSTIFDVDKAKAVYEWYQRKDPKDHSIEEYFEEYKHCTDKMHPYFNSNYGIYAYSEEGLDKCVKRLKESPETRHAMFCINNNEAMSDRSIDKLCTNTIQFFIRDNRLIMLVQMRSSNFLTLLPYDSFMFCYWYWYVFYKLYNENGIKDLEPDMIHINAASLHLFHKDLIKIKETSKNSILCKEIRKDNCFETYKELINEEY